MIGNFGILAMMTCALSLRAAEPATPGALCWQSGADRAIVADGWKAVSLAAEPAWRLYHLTADANEKTDLAREEPARLQSLVQSWYRLPRQTAPATWAETLALPSGEQGRRLYNGVSLAGWQGSAVWTAEPDGIRAATDTALAASTYLFSQESFREFRLLMEVKQTVGPGFSRMHSAVAVLGERTADAGGAYGFTGPLVMFCQDWGIWEANGRNRLVPAGHSGTLQSPAEKAGEWNRVEVLVKGDRIRCAANGQLIFDFTDEPGRLKPSPIGLQLHGSAARQEYRFRGLVLSTSPQDRLLSVSAP